MQNLNFKIAVDGAEVTVGTTVSLHKIALHPYANEILRKLSAPLVRKSGFPYFCKVSPLIPVGTQPNQLNSTTPPKRNVRKLSADELDGLLE